jgi:two-component system response regulator
MDTQEIRVMLIEDSPEDIAYARRILKRNHLDRHLAVAAGGKEAFESLEHLADNESLLPNLIILDINLPDMSGIELLGRIKKDSRLRHIPVVMLTGSNIDGDIQKSYDMGANTYLVKPISNDALMLIIENLFSMKPHR